MTDQEQLQPIRKFCHIYIRVSSGEQAETGNSLEYQRATCREFALRNGFIVRDVYTDSGISGRKLERPELVRLRREIENGEHIISYSVSRISRSLEDFIKIMSWAEERRITIHTIKENIDTRTAYGNFVTMVFSALSQLESNLTQERMAEINARKSRRGETTKTPPYGYKSVKYKPGVPSRVIPDVHEQNAITRMFELRWKDKMFLTPFRKIADVLQEEGYKPRRSEVFSVESMRKIMSREFDVRMRIHKTLYVPEHIIKRYSDLIMPFIVPMEDMEKYVIKIGDDYTYNGEYEDDTIITERPKFFGPSGKKKRGKGQSTTDVVDLHLMFYDRQQEEQVQVENMIHQEAVIRRSIVEEHVKEFRRILERLITSRVSLDSEMESIRTTLNEELKIAKTKYNYHVEECRSKDPKYQPFDDEKALEFRKQVLTLEKRLESIKPSMIIPTIVDPEKIGNLRFQITDKK